MNWYVIFLIFIIVVALLIAYGYYMLIPITAVVITGAGEKNSQPKSCLRVKNLAKHPRSKSEAEVVKYLEEITGDKFPTVYPCWLTWRGRTLELDGFNGKIALEFSGPLHTKWNPSYEDYNVYFERIVRDVVKLRLCKKRGIPLMVVDASLPRQHWRNYVSSRLFDYGCIDKPVEYIPVQTAQPFRNEQLEMEMGLTGEMDAAKKL